MITNRIVIFAALISAMCGSALAQEAPSWMSPTLTTDESGTSYWIAAPLATAMEGIGEIEIPATLDGDDGTFPVKEIQGFGDCADITKVTIKGTDVEIDANAFQNCVGLAEVVVEGSLKSIGESAFSGCTALKSINIVAGLESIGQSAFASCTALEEISIPKSVTEIKSKCFKSCTSLKSVHFEGGGLTTIPQQMFLSCTSIEEIEIPDGVTAIKSWAFNACANLKTLTLPKTITSISPTALQGCSNFETVKLYAVASAGSSSFEEAFKASSTQSSHELTLLVPNNELKAYQSITSWTDVFKNIKGIFTFTTSDDGTISAADSETFLDVFRALSNPDGAFANANVCLKNDIAFSPVVLDYEELSASNIFATVDAFPTVASYAGEFNGANISGMTLRSGGLFGTLESGAQVNNLVLSDATLYVDPTDADTYDVEGDDVTIHILAKTNKGDVTNFGFSGDIIVDEALATGKEISVCAVNDNEDGNATINGYVFLGSLATIGEDGNKRCITIKQNLGVKRPPGKSTKMATNKSLRSNKSVTDVDLDSEEFMQPVCAFTDEEFASGLVAYWLNFTGPGFTGDYTGYWAQGKKVPVPATTISGGEGGEETTNALDMVNYGTTNMKHITSAPTFANVGSQITITYDVTPTHVFIGGEPFTGFGANSMTVTFDPSKNISLAFPKAQLALDEPTAPAEPGISVSGRTVTVTGVPASAKLKLTSLTGRVAATATGQTISAPAPGLYFLTVEGQMQKKIVLK